MIKKLILSSFVVVAFALYVFVSHHNDDTVTNPAKTVGTTPIASPSPTASSGKYKNGGYTGDIADAFYGNIQVKAVIQNGRLSAVQFLQYPNDRPTSIQINQQAMPLLQQEAVAAQSGQVDTVTGATDSSQAFVQSLTSALNQAKG
jgi:uncharacterized protein with FMN-binding domain